MEYAEESVALPGADSWFGFDVLDAFDYAASRNRCSTQRKPLEEMYVSWVHDEVMEERIEIYSARHQDTGLLGGFTGPPMVRADLETLITYDAVDVEVRTDAPDELVDRLVDDAADYLTDLDL